MFIVVGIVYKPKFIIRLIKINDFIYFLGIKNDSRSKVEYAIKTVSSLNLC